MKCSWCTSMRDKIIIISCTINKQKQHHSFKDIPSVFYGDGTKFWQKNGDFHRENGPAVIDYLGLKWWYYDGRAALKVLKQKLHVKKVINIYYGSKEIKVGLITKKINDCWYEVIIGDEKKLVVSLDKYKEG